jgi:phenylalanyl-tRNA synthetase beta chain
MVEVKVLDAETCPRFSAVLMEGVVVKESPAWLQTRLLALGQRPINNIVDATNYVMFALGQPMHAYDADKFPKVAGKWQMVVRKAVAGETVSLLAEAGKDEERTIKLDGSELLIVDGSTDLPVGLAGIKGGRFAELSSETTTIILEAAHFDPITIRKTARRLGILTDASKRFENQPAPELPMYAQQMIVSLIKEIAGGEVVGMVDVQSERVPTPPVLVTRSKVNRLLGLSLDIDQVQHLIERTGAQVERINEGTLSVVAPWERTDLTIEVDYVEEVGRLYGFDHVVSVSPEAVPLTEINVRQYYTEQVRQVLLTAGFSEVITSSFAKKADIQLQNALASDKSFVRKTLMKNIEAVLDANFIYGDLLGVADLRVFEIGTVFDKTEAGIGEHTALTLGVRTKGNGYSQKDDIVLQQGKTAVETILGTGLAWKVEKGIAELNISELLEQLPVPTAYEVYKKPAPVTYRRPSVYPAMSRDIALWVAESEAATEVEAVLVAAAGNLLVRRSLFDTFTKDGRTSYAFRLVFQSKERTLTDGEVNDVMETINKVAANRGWEVR